MENEEYQRRLAKLKAYREAGVNPYPNNLLVTHTSQQILEQFDAQSREQLEGLTQEFSLAGRVMSNRVFGKAAFLHIQDRKGQLQLFVEQKNPEVFALFGKIDLGDFVWVKGHLFRTKTGQLTLHVDQMQLAAKALQPLPEKWHGLQDVETRYRQRYLDLTSNGDVRQIFLHRSRIIQQLRDFFVQRDFIEVETPMMHPLAGGAAARPFVTHHNTLDMELFLRIAPELYLKRLVVGGMERVFEINRNFRNEGISTQHNPEFTMLEFYQSYATFEDLIVLSEELLAELCRAIHGQEAFPYQENTISLQRPFARITHAEMLERGEASLIQPTFVTDFPLKESPLARKNENNPDIVDRFELYIAGMEVANAFSELNDPIDQRERFQAQVEAKKRGDEEAMPYDEDYIRALEQGMPPTAGEGIGIDRLVMLLTNQSSIREVILFPLMRSEQSS